MLPAGDPFPTRGLWRLASDPQRPDFEKIHWNTYAKLFQLGLYDELGVYNLTGLAPDLDPGTPPFEVEVLGTHGDDGFFMASVGVGRKRQLGGDNELGTAHVELVAAMGAHHPLLASVVGVVGNSIHQHSGGDSAYKVGDTVGLQLPEIGAAGFVLGDGGKIEMAEGTPIQLLEMIPVSDEEYERVRRHGSRAWLEALPPMSPAARAARWKLMHS